MDSLTPPGPPSLPLADCGLIATGQLTEDSDPILYAGEAVEVSATHIEGEQCINGLNLIFRRGGNCPLTLSFQLNDGLWALGAASIISTPECGDGWGSGKTYTAVMSESTGTIVGLPSPVAFNGSPEVCTALDGPVELLGSILVRNGDIDVRLGLTGLGAEGSLPSTANNQGVCGEAPTACSGLNCGTDPLFGTSCGSCAAGTFCESGLCVEGSPAQEACNRYLSDRAALSEAAWNGNANSCNAGSMTTDWQSTALLSVNLYRWFAGLPPLTLNTGLFASEQQCALMMHANQTLSHNPAPNWACYSSAGAEAAGASNIATTPAVSAVDLYMLDPGNPNTLGHRRWILSNWLASTAFGSTNSYSCMATSTAGNGVGSNLWTAWPSPGFYPMGWHANGWTDLDANGWSIQSDSIDLSNAQVSITRDGTPLSVAVTPLWGGYGSESALSIIPQGWSTQAGAIYTVQVTGIASPIEYQVEAIDCSQFL